MAVECVAYLVRIFFVDARAGKIGEPFGSVDVKTGGSSGRLSTHHLGRTCELAAANLGESAYVP